MDQCVSWEAPDVRTNWRLPSLPVWRNRQKLLLELFREAYDEAERHGADVPCRGMWEDTMSPWAPYLGYLDVEASLDELQEGLSRHGTLQLRPYRGEDRCVIGCGNSPIVDGGGYLLGEHTALEYRDLHAHPDCYTINPEPAYNPCLVASYGEQEIVGLPDGCFRVMESEGVVLVESERFYLDTRRLLMEGGVFSIDGEAAIRKVGGELWYADGSPYDRRRDLFGCSWATDDRHDDDDVLATDASA